MNCRRAIMFLLLWAVVATFAAQAQSAKLANRVLELNGDGSFVELPPNIFSNLPAATVEGWVKWHAFRNYGRFFDFGAPSNEVAVITHLTSPDLRFNLYPTNAPREIVRVNGALRTHEWFHVAAVSGPGGMKLFLNGALVAQTNFPGSFTSIGNDARNLLGRGLWRNPTDDDFEGQMDEVRVWDHERSVEQIRSNMNRRLTGKEAGLVGLWNFDDMQGAVVKDAGPGGHDGKLMGDARTVAGEPATSLTAPTNSTPALSASNNAPVTAAVQAAITNHVLSLDEEGSFVELPTGSFTNLAEATVEGWVKWRTFRKHSRFFDFGKAWQAMEICNQEISDSLYFSMGRPPFTMESEVRLLMPGVIKLNEWCHIAAVTGTGGVRIYFNGALVATNEYAGSFSALASGDHNYLGRSNWREGQFVDEDFDGQMDEVRVWSVARSAEQIRAQMFTSLTGKESGLVSLWNFENVTDDVVKDAGPGGLDGKLMGEAHTVAGGSPGANRAPATTQTSFTHQALSLDGDGSFVELPPGSFTNLTEATIEGWIKWDEFRSQSRFFDFKVAAGWLSVRNDGTSTDLNMTQLGAGGGDKIVVPGILTLGQWIHVASVITTNSRQLYVNGVRVQRPSQHYARDTAGFEPRNFLGRSAARTTWTNDQDFRGQMAEVRVWQVARSAEQIRANLFKQLTGTESGLVSLWNFQNVTNGIVKDAGPGGHDGRLAGEARIVAARLPSSVVAPTNLSAPPRTTNAALSTFFAADKVLQLDGTSDSFVQLPPNLLDGLDAVTIEGWVKWTKGGVRKGRFATFGAGEGQHTRFDIGNYDKLNVLHVSLNKFETNRWIGRLFDVSEALRENEWMHLAGVLTRTNMQLFTNGIFAGASEGGTLEGTPRCFLGAGGFEGQMEDVRLWKTARTAEEIRTNQFTKLSGNEPGLLAWWNFDTVTNQTVWDSSTNGLHAKLVGGSRVVLSDRKFTGRVPVPGPVLELNGWDGFVDFGLNGPVLSVPFTEEVWIWQPQSNTNRWGPILGGSEAGPSVRAPTLFVRDRLSLHGGFGDGSSWRAWNSPDNILAPGVWQHIAATYDGANYRVYVDGKLVSSAPLSAKPVETPLRWLGKTDNPTFFEGQMDEVRVWNVPRTELQIREAMSQKLSGTEPGLVSLWRFDGVTNGVVRDLAVGAHHGKLMGRASVVTASTSLAPSPMLQSQLELVGTVTDSLGNAASNAVVTTRSAGSDVAITRTDATGNYRLLLPDLAAAIDLTVNFNDEHGAQSGIVLKSGAATRADVKLASPIGLRGSVLDTDGRAMAGVMVQLQRSEVGGQKSEPNDIVAIALTHTDGSYHFRRSQAGKFVVRAQTADGFVTFEGGRAVEVKEDITLLGIDFRLPPRSAEIARGTNAPPENLAFDRKRAASGGWVTLPDHIFDELDEATIEGWLKCEDFNNHYFYSYGGPGSRLLIKNNSESAALRVAAGLPGAAELSMTPAGLKSNEWCHVAWVTGKGGMLFYMNGVRVANHASTASFSALKNQMNAHRLGQESTGPHGIQLDEWRVWVTQRTPDEIRENMFKRLNGRESGLAALWNFDDPDEPGRDASPHGFHGIVTTGANAAPGTLPNAIQGIVTDKDGRAVPNAEITFERGGTRVASTTTDFLGKYLYLGAGLDQPVTINARQGELSCEPVEVTPNGPLELNLKLRDLARLSGRTLALDESPIPSVVVQALPVADENEASTNSEPGLQVELFALAELKGFPTVTASLTPKLQRVDPQIDFPLGTGSVAPVEFDSACFARWTGALRIEAARKYTFHLRAKSQARLFIDGALVAQSTFQAPLAGIATDIANISKAEGAGAVTLSSGFHALKVEFYNAHGRSACQLFWSAERLPREIVPARVLFRNSTITARPTMATTISDANGKFRFYDLAAGKYTLRAQLPGRFMELDNGRVITLEKDQPVLNQDFKFAPFKKGVWRHLSRLDGLAEDNRNHAVEVGEAHAKVAKHAKGIETLKGIQGQPNSEAAT